MKRIIFIAIVVLAALFIFPRAQFIQKPAITTTTVTPAAQSVSVIFDTGSTVATVSGVTATNAFEALTAAAKKQNFELKTKQYDFGVFIQQIGTLANTKEKSWIYFVNGKAGTVAADKQPVKTGDMVEWKYMTPTSE